MTRDPLFHPILRWRLEDQSFRRHLRMKRPFLHPSFPAINRRATIVASILDARGFRLRNSPYRNSRSKRNKPYPYCLLVFVLLAWFGLSPKCSQVILEQTVQGGDVSKFIR
jgi:hypothetical protein